MNIFNNFLNNYKKNPNKVLLQIKDTNKEFTYSDIYQNTLRIIFFLKNYKKKKIGLFFENDENFLSAILASLYLKTCIVPFNFRMSDEDLKKQFKKFDIKILLADFKFLSKLKKFNGINKIFIEHDEVNSSYKKIKLKEVGDRNFDFLISSTSGSTGEPKGIVLTYKNKVDRVLMLKKIYKIKRRDKFLITTPLYHTLGFRLMLFSLFYGNQVLLLNNFNLNALEESLIHYRVNFYMTVSSQLKTLIYYSKRKIGNDLRILVSSSDSLNFQEIQKLKSIFKCHLHECYGLSEGSILTDVNLRNLSSSNFHNGKPINGVSLRILKNNNKLTNSKNQKGEICFKSKYIFKNYYKYKNMNHYFSKGYFKTGDFGFFDDNHNLKYLSRVNEIFKVGDVNVFPDDIKNKVGKINNVLDSYVFPIKHKTLGNVVGLAIKCKKNILNAKTVFKFCLKNLSPFQYPNKIIFFEEFPKNHMGKIDKKCFS
jgi:long-chain acyl-CoA synthetase